MLRSFLVTMVVSIFALCEGNAQTIQYSTESRDSTNLYQKSLLEFSKYVERGFPKVQAFNIENSILTTWLPTKNLGKIKINYIEQSDISKVQKKTRYIIRIIPMRVKDNVFFVNIIPLQVEYLENGKVNLINSGVMQINFRYESSLSGFTFIGVEGGFGKLE